MHIKALIIQFYNLVGFLSQIKHVTKCHAVLWSGFLLFVNQLICIDFFAEFGMFDDRKSRCRGTGKTDMKSQLFSADISCCTDQVIEITCKSIEKGRVPKSG